MGCRAGIPVVFVAQMLLTATLAAPAGAADRLCDSAFQNCRVPLRTLIQNEKVGIDVAFWVMEDTRYAADLVARHRAGVPVRVLVDTSANAMYPANANAIKILRDAGIPIRDCIQSSILHWKMMLFTGQNTVEFSGANYTSEAFVPITAYTNYIDEAIVSLDDPTVVNSFKTQFDNHWLSDTRFKDYANVRRPLTRRHGIYTKDPALNFVPGEDFGARSVGRYNAETSRIDAIIYRITDRRHTDALIAARKRGVTVRLITEPQQYRSTNYLWHSWNVDRLYMAGVQVRHRKHAGQTHQKTTLLYSQGMTVFGSSNWTSASATSQIEHNYFTRNPSFFVWFRDMFERKWYNEKGYLETQPFVPLAPAVPAYVAPVSGATGQPTSGLRLQWKPGYWAHAADIYFGTSSAPPLVARDVRVTPNTTASYALPTLQAGRTYYWKIVSKTMANKTAAGPVRSFVTR